MRRGLGRGRTLIVIGAVLGIISMPLAWQKAGGIVLDAQLTTPHLASMGVRDVSRDWFLDLLRAVRDHDVRLRRDRLDVDRLA